MSLRKYKDGDRVVINYRDNGAPHDQIGTIKYYIGQSFSGDDAYSVHMDGDLDGVRTIVFDEDISSYYENFEVDL
jgi:hypothetical protein